MRIHYSFQVTRLLRSLGENGSDLRRTIESLLKNPTPDWALEVTNKPGMYELLALGGYWIMYRVEKSDVETVIVVILIEGD